MSIRTTLSLFSVALAFACDVDRPEALELLADPDLDPEVRAELAAEFADDDADPDPLQGQLELATPGDPSGVTCFFGCTPAPSDPATWTPVVINPYVQVNQQGNTILYMQAAASYIASGATVTLQVPGSATTYGPYALSYDVSGTLQRANVTGGFPAGTCRNITVTNPNFKSSSPVMLCR